MGYSILLCFEHTVCGYVFRRNEFLYIIYVTRESLELVTSTFNNSVFSLFTNTFHYFFYFLIDLFLCLFYFCDKVTFISILIGYFLWDAAFHLFNPSGIYVSAFYWFVLHLILYLLERPGEVQCEDWTTDTVSLR